MKKMLLLIFCLTTFLAVHAQRLLSLSEIRDSIVASHPALKATEASIRAAEAKAAGAYSWMPPELGAGLFQAPYNLSRWKGSPAMPGMGMFMISAEQMFPNRKSQEAEHAFLQSAAAVEEQKQSGILNELMSQVRSAYYTLIIDEKKQALYEQNKKLLDFMIQSAEIRYKNNLGNINSYYKLKAALAKLNTAELVLQAGMKQQRALINSLMQQDVQISFKVDTAFSWYSFSAAVQEGQAFEQTSSYRVLEKSIAASQLEQQSEWASLKPQFGLKFEHMVGFGHQPQMFSLMAMMKIPMAKWSARGARARIESLSYEQESLRSQQAAYINQQFGKSKSLFAQLKGIRQELDMYVAEIIPALQKNMQTLQISYEQNKAEIFELYDAWQSLLDAQMEYLNAMQRGLEVQSELMRMFEIQ